MKPLSRVGAVAAARGWRHCLILAKTEGNEAASVIDSLQKAGIQTNLWEPSLSYRCPTPSLVDSVTYDAASTDIDAVVGLGHGGVLDLAKAAAAIIPLVRASAQYSPIFTRPGSGSAKPGRELTELLVNGNMRGKGNAVGANGLNGALPKWPNAPVAESFLLGSDAKPRASTLLAGSSLPLLLVPTTAAVAATSGRCLLRPEGPEALVPLAIAGPGPYGVGVGLQATEVVADATVTQGQSARGTAAAMAHAISVFVDSAAASGGTVKQQQLMDDMMTGAGSSFSALRHPEHAAVDSMEAALAAGVAASDADANARGGLSVVHTLASVLVGMRPEVPFPLACRVLLPPVLRAWAEEVTEGNEVAAVSAIALLSEAMLGPAPTEQSLQRLADFVDNSCGNAGLPPELELDPAESPESVAVLLAANAAQAPVMSQRPAPAWVNEPQRLEAVFRAAVGGNRPHVLTTCPGRGREATTGTIRADGLDKTHRKHVYNSAHNFGHHDVRNNMNPFIAQYRIPKWETTSTMYGEHYRHPEQTYTRPMKNRMPVFHINL
ncbi:unnamed protein product [Symbiodinium sp. CCMP2592]|nr:unnamed protein product [Symbiodinium sp. CCMP2592]